MGSFEGDIGNAAFERLQEPANEGQRTLGRRIEDFAIDNMRSIAIGASAAILGLASIVLVQESQVPAEVRVAVDPSPVGSVDKALRPTPEPEWQHLRKPQELMALQAPQFDRVPPVYAARRSNRNEREDSLTWTQQGAGGTEARVAIMRRSVPLAPPSLFIDMTRQQAERGVSITRAGATGAMTTKFGSLEIADMTFSDTSGVAQACLAFRSSGEGGAPVLSGWYCAPQGAVVERPELACFIDRLSLLKSGEDHALRKFFTEAEQRRQPCPSGRLSSGRKPTWLDQDGRVPAMRGAEDVTGSITRPKR